MIVDIIVIIVTLLFGFLGYKDGAFKKLLAIIGFWGGLIVATKLMYPVGTLFLNWFDLNKEAANVMAFYLVFMFISGFEYVLVKKYGSSADLSIGHRVGGIVLGIFQGLLILSLVLLLLAVVGIPNQKIRDDSTLYTPVVNATPTVFDYTATWLPETKTFLEEIESNIRAIKKK